MQKYPNQVKVVGNPIPGAVNVFEIEIEENQLIFSRRKGNGFVDSPSKLAHIFKEIDANLEQEKD